MAALLDGESISCGGMTFYGFHDYSSVATRGASSVCRGSIEVSPFQDPVNLEWGLWFSSSEFDVKAGQTQDTVFHFDVASDPGNLISGNTLTLMGSAIGGRITVIESVGGPPEGNPFLAGKISTLRNSEGTIFDHEIFAFQVPAIHVSKDIALVGGSGGASVSDFTQTFSVVPEPLTLVGVFLSIAGLGGYVLRRRKK